MYQASVPLFVRAFNNLSAIIDKAVAHAEAHKYDPQVLAEARLYPDMFPFSGQVQRASDTAKAAVARLAGVDVPSFADDEVTMADLRARIAKTVSFIESVPAASIEGSEERKISLTMRGNTVETTGQAYLIGRQIPNFFFHVTTAYDILRHNGVEIGKRDFLG
jgi:hypothetical protein